MSGSPAPPTPARAATWPLPSTIFAAQPIRSRKRGRGIAVGIVPLAIAFAFAPLAPPAAPAGPIEDRLDEALGLLDARELSTGVLYDRVLPLSGIERFSGSAGAAVASRGLWRQIYEELRRASADPDGRPTAEAVIERAQHAGDAVPLALLWDDYERIRADALDRGALVLRGGRLERGSGPAFERRTVFAATALREWTYRGGEVRFVLGRGDYFSNRGDAPRLEADLDDGAGFRALSFGVPLATRYATTGTKTLRLRAVTADGAAREAAFAFAVRALAAPLPDDTLFVTGTIPYQGGVASGQAYVYLAEGRTSLVNPVVAVEGFDLDDSMNWDELYAQLNQEHLIEDLRARGYDAVVLNFAGATDYLQRNAFVLVELLQQVRAAIAPQQTVALAGASMGGLVSRYALAYMESHALPHAVRTFLSFDTPHRGANIPLGIQYWMKFFATQSADAAFLLSRLDSPAARQMLVYHHADPPGATGQPDPLRGAFEADLAAIGGWPHEPRRVAIANGSDNGTGQGFAPGAQIIQWAYNNILVEIRGNVWAIPNLTNTVIFDGRTRILFTTTSQTVTTSGTLPYDNAPGGSRATMAQMDSVPAPYGDIVALHPAHGFIPTVSALDYATTDLFHDISADPDPVALTPFDAIYTQAANQEHVAVTAGNAAWILDQIGIGVTGVAPASGAGARLRPPAPNPSPNAFRIGFTLERGGTVDLRVFGLDGREIASLARGAHDAGPHEVTWNGRDARGANVPAGVYFLRLAAEGTLETRRVVRYR